MQDEVPPPLSQAFPGTVWRPVPPAPSAPLCPEPLLLAGRPWATAWLYGASDSCGLCNSMGGWLRVPRKW